MQDWNSPPPSTTGSTYGLPLASQPWLGGGRKTDIIITHNISLFLARPPVTSRICAYVICASFTGAISYATFYGLAFPIRFLLHLRCYCRFQIPREKVWQKTRTVYVCVFQALGKQEEREGVWMTRLELGTGITSLLP